MNRGFMNKGTVSLVLLVGALIVFSFSYVNAFLGPPINSGGPIGIAPVDHHFACTAQGNGYVCSRVTGQGVDHCRKNSDCTETYMQCNSAKQCIVKQGNGVDDCTSSTDCEDHDYNWCPSATMCQQWGGIAKDQCAVAGDCTAKTHLECMDDKCVAFVGKGADHCKTNDNCKIEPFEMECVMIQGPRGPGECHRTTNRMGSPGCRGSAEGASCGLIGEEELVGVTTEASR